MATFYPEQKFEHCPDVKICTKYWTQYNNSPSAAKYILWPIEFFISYLLFVSKPTKATIQIGFILKSGHHYFPLSTRISARDYVSQMLQIRTVVQYEWPWTDFDFGPRKLRGPENTYILSCTTSTRAPVFQWLEGMWRAYVKVVIHSKLNH